MFTNINLNLVINLQPNETEQYKAGPQLQSQTISMQPSRQTQIPLKPPQLNRQINSLHPNPNFPNNKIKSTSTNIFTFIPINLYHQMKEMPNIYFVLIAVLQCIKEISVTNGKPTVLLPLSIVMLTVMVKDAIEEINRYSQDRKENHRQAEVYNAQAQRWVRTKWEDIQVGNVLRLYQDEPIPCDALIIKTQIKDKCYVQTKSLDGQTNPKAKKGFANHLKFKHMSQQQRKSLFKQSIQVNYSAPEEQLHKFSGNISHRGVIVPVTIDNLILRSCILKNTHEVICICLYTGSDTKVIKNSCTFEAKEPKLMAEIQQKVIQIFIWQIVIALAAALLNTLIENSYPALMAYLPMSRFWILTWSWWLMMTYFVPISLIVTIKMVEMFQGMIIEKDRRGYCQDYDCYIAANNTAVNENLGQIKYIFSDKTGTLTKNQMSFRKLYFSNTCYGQSMSPQQQQYLQKQLQSQNIQSVSVYDQKLQKMLGTAQFQDYLRVLYLCHDILVEKDKDGRLVYNSGSPDEISLINFAKMYGRELIEETDTVIKVAQTRGGSQVMRFEKMALLEFNSDRKRMSKIVKHPDGKIQILTKGADSAVAVLLKSSQKSKAQRAQQQATNRFSTEGLRTLMLAKRWISQQQFNQWYSGYQKAASQIEGREKALQECYKQIERDLQFVGITAIEDKLQNEVAETIRLLKEFGMQFFILTGDKRQTAINIARACGMIGENTKVIKIPDYDEDRKEEFFAEWSKLKKEATGDVVYTLDASKKFPPELPLHQTICYRCIPNQKEEFVRYVKESVPYLTLAIGDGANDKNMITQADVGVAVKGKEGSEAARVSDYVVGQFKLLSLLTLYYGREWYRKNSQLIAYNFFKNWFHVSSVVVYGAYTYFSGVLIFDIYMYQLFNLLFAALPIIAFALFDYQYTASQSLSIKYKQIYKPGVNNDEFNQTIYFMTIGRGFVYGMVAMLMIFFVLEDTVLDADGRTGYLAQSGSVLYFDIVVIINLRILVMANGFSPFLLFSVFGSIGMYWVAYQLFISTIDGEMSSSFRQEWTTWNICFVHLILIMMLILTEFGYKKYKWYDRESKRNPLSLVAEVWKKMGSMQREEDD